MTAIDNVRKRLRVAPAFALAFSVTGVAAAAPCADLNPVNPIYGAGGSAVTATLASIATALVSLPEEDRVTIFYNDPGACTGYNSFVAGSSTTILDYKYWNAAGVEGTCQAPASNTTFAHMGNTPLLCPGNQPLPAGFAKFVAPVQTINLITHEDSTEDSISAEALYHIYGFGPGASGRSVEPWIVPNATFARRTSSFVHQILAGAIGVPATGFKIPSASPNNFLDDNLKTVTDVGDWGKTKPNEPIGYVSGSTAELGETNPLYVTKTLAYQHFDQTCAYLPDTSRTQRDRLNARTGQYYLWTPAWIYARVNGAGEVESEITKKFIGWFDGTLASPDGVDIQEIIIDSGDIPLCAMQAIRPEGDLSPIQSYAPDEPCNGYYEYVKLGDTDYTACDSDDECAGYDETSGTTEICSYGFCELTYRQPT